MIVLHIMRWVLALLFLEAGFMKALDPSAFLTNIENYQLLPYTFAVALSLYLPYLEIFGAGAMLVPKYQKAGLMLWLGLMLLFVVTLISAWARGLDITCGCFGKLELGVNYPQWLIRDLVITGALFTLIRCTKDS